MTKRKAFTLIELLVVVAIIALLISILLPSLSRARELSKRLTCTANVKGIGTSCKIYANDNEDSWPVPTFSESASTIMKWIKTDVEVGYSGSHSDTKPNRWNRSMGATTTISPTRGMWMLVRSGDLTAKQYVCPSSSDTLQNEQSYDLYYDFYSYDNISYGYQVPFGPRSSRASEDVDARMVLASDKGPYSKVGVSQAKMTASSFTGVSPAVTNPDMISPLQWKPWNSGNHGGTGSGEGQNLLYGDGHAEFAKSPNKGIDQDNVFTRIYDPTTPWGLQGGELPGPGPGATKGGYPGEGSFVSSGSGPTGDCQTDSLIYP
jgi:prepilin-type N-terminal cleavage/methylation domain-containing protein